MQYLVAAEIHRLSVVSAPSNANASSNRRARDFSANLTGGQVTYSAEHSHPWSGENHFVTPRERGADCHRIVLPIARNRTELFDRTPPPATAVPPSRSKSSNARANLPSAMHSSQDQPRVFTDRTKTARSGAHAVEKQSRGKHKF